ncbi:putative autophagy protein [Xylaria palmicola]|nr:putative autophagy protein [Xylaria palmicola]
MEGPFSDPEKNSSSDQNENLSVSGERMTPDLVDERYLTTKKEIYAFYWYYVGCNGLTLFNFAPTLFQSLLSQAAGETGLLRFAGRDRSIESVVLLTNGISFAIQIVFFLAVGSFADFGRWRPYILIVMSAIAYAVGFAWLGVHDADKWHAGVGLYIVGLVAYQAAYTFWNAAFPGLARNTPEMEEKADAYVAGTITRDEYDYADSLTRSRLVNVAYVIQSFAEIVILAIMIGMMFGLRVRESEANNDLGLSAIIAFGTAIWLVVSLPWFFLEKHRPGQDPGNRSIIVAGLWQIGHAFKTIWQLKQSLLYLIGYFLLGDSMNTTFTVIATLQNTIAEYDALQLLYFLIVAITAQGVGVGMFYWCQQHFKLGTKTMFNIVATGIVVLDAWGMVGIWTDRFGFHNLWEFWLYQIYSGLFIGPWWSYSQIMISEVTPRGHDFLFFSLFSVIGKTSSFIGPLVSSAIIDVYPSHNSSSPFYFLFALSLVSCLFLVFFIDLKKSQVEQERFLRDKARHAAEKLPGSGADVGKK